ncbi:MAG: SRPBCC family protein [Bradyrhizobium sp.]|nr:SRPBCC family protein [Bradyrhizobium sp.]
MTDKSKSRDLDISRFSPETVYTIYIAAQPDEVWRALTSAKFSRQYFFGFAVEADLRAGGAFIVRAPDGSEHISGEVIVCQPPQRLTITWDVNWPGLVEALGRTLVTYETEPAGDAVRLTMTEAHDRPLSDDILSGGRQGWPAILSGLKSVLETGKPLAVKMPPPARMLAALKTLGVKLPG